MGIISPKKTKKIEIRTFDLIIIEIGKFFKGGGERQRVIVCRVSRDDQKIACGFVLK
jgi:hypothetical protein